MSEQVNRVETISNIVNDLAVLRRRSAHAMDKWWEGFSPSQREVIGILVRHPNGTNIKALACILNVSSSAITQRVESLEKLNLVERSMSLHDNRFVQVTLSKRAIEILHKTVPPFSQHSDEDHFFALNDKELQRFSKLLAKVAHVIEPIQN